MKNPRKNLYRQLLTAALLVGGTFQIASSVLAQTAPTPTRAGAAIENTATATYTDPNNPGTTLGSSSNKVIISVAEVAGVFVNNAGVVDDTPATGIQSGDLVYFYFDVTNVGNDPTNLVIPNLATVAGPGAVVGDLATSIDGGTTYTLIAVGGSFTSGQIQPGASVRVRVPVRVNTGVSTGTITVTLGDTTPSSQQNVPYLPSSGSVFTVDNNGQIVPPAPNLIPEANLTAPANGEREASNNQSATINATSQAFAAILKSSAHNNNNTPAITTDDKVTYGLSLRVDGNPPSGSSLIAAPLIGTALSGGVSTGGAADTTTKYILVSDAIPANTDLDSAPIIAPTPDWKVVYTTSDPTLVKANEAAWTTVAPTTPAGFSAVTRVGFIYAPTLGTNSPAIPTNTTVTGFTFTVKTETSFTSGGQIANIAQLFGTTQGGGTDLVYDESGDANPTNYNNDGTPGSIVPTFGIANPNNDGTDPGGNTGEGLGGEDNVINIPAPGGTGVLLGPEGTPGATGPTGNNDDFTNRTTPLPPGIDTELPNNQTNPDPITFINTAQNSSAAPANISIIPTNPADLGIADLPANTVVTISAVGVGTRNYVWNGSVFLFDTDSDPLNGGQSPIDSAAEVLTYLNVAPGAQVSYSVVVNLPITTLSTDLVNADPDGEYGYPVPVTAFIETAPNGVIDPAETQNTTINRSYVGFLRLLKESRILQGTGPAVSGVQGTFSIAPKNPAPGNIIEYRITYSNISSVPSVGSNSVGLSANNIIITENGTAGSNNWGKDNDPAGTPGFGTIDTLNVPGIAIDSGGAPVAFFSGTTGTTSSGDVADVTAYQVNTGATPVVGPGVSRTFIFQRLVDN